MLWWVTLHLFLLSWILAALPHFVHVCITLTFEAAQQDMEYLRDLEARLELAQLQQQLCVELSQLGSETPRSPRLYSPGVTRTNSTPGATTTGTKCDMEEAITQLSHGPLLSLTEMFTNYANPFGLHESKLCLLWASGSTVSLSSSFRPDFILYAYYSIFAVEFTIRMVALPTFRPTAFWAKLWPDRDFIHVSFAI